VYSATARACQVISIVPDPAVRRAGSAWGPLAFAFGVASGHAGYLPTLVLQYASTGKETAGTGILNL